MLTPGMLSFTTSIPLPELAQQLLPTIEWNPELCHMLHSAIAHLNIVQSRGAGGHGFSQHPLSSSSENPMLPRAPNGGELNEAWDRLQTAVQTTLSDGLRRLVDGQNQTNDPANMFLMPFSHLIHGGSCSSLQVDLGQATPIQGFKIWNYNASLDDSYRGLRRASILMDGVLWTPNRAQTLQPALASPSNHSSPVAAATPSSESSTGFLIRKAPGNCVFEYGQVVPLNKVTAQPNAGAVPPNAGRTTRPLPGGSKLGGQQGKGGGEQQPKKHVMHVMEGTGVKGIRSQAIQPLNTSLANCEALSGGRGSGGSAAAVPFGYTGNRTTPVAQQYETPLLPRGHIFKFVLLSTYGDRFYMGLNGLELYDECNEKVLGVWCVGPADTVQMLPLCIYMGGAWQRGTVRDRKVTTMRAAPQTD